jgi:predicted ATP-dependent serine protease
MFDQDPDFLFCDDAEGGTAPTIITIPQGPVSGALCEFEDYMRAVDTAHFTSFTNGVPLGVDLPQFPLLQQAVGGALFPGLHVLHGQPGIGKTALVLRIASTCSCSAIYVSAEMAISEIILRLMAQVNAKPVAALRCCEFGVEQQAEFREALYAQAPSLHLVDATSDKLPMGSLRQLAKSCRGDGQHLLIVIDSVHMWAASLADAGQTEYESLNTALGELKKLAYSEQCAVIVVAHRNRSSMKDSGMSSPKGTADFEYGGEAVWSLDYASEEDKEAPKRDVNLTISKNRFGVGNVPHNLTFTGATQLFEEPT